MEAHQDLVDSLYSHADQQLGFKKPPTLIFQSDPRNYGALSKTAQYDPRSQEITIYVDGRHIKDILRSFAHELVHHHQNEQGRLSGANVAQGEQDFDDIEGEAYHTGNLKLFRKWEDGIKQKNPTIYNERRIYKMSTKKWKNKELSNLMTEKFGYKMDLSKLNENIQEEQLEEAEMNEEDSRRVAVYNHLKQSDDEMYKIGAEDMEDESYKDSFDSWSGTLANRAKKKGDMTLLALLQKLRYDQYGAEGIDMKQEAAEQLDENGCRNNEEMDENGCRNNEEVDEGKGKKCPSCGEMTTKGDGKKCPSCDKKLAGEVMDEELGDGKIDPDDDEKAGLKGADPSKVGRGDVAAEKGGARGPGKKNENLKEHRVQNHGGFYMDLNKLLK